MKIKWLIVLVLAVVAVGIYNTVREKKAYEKEEKKYFDDLNLYLKGVVESVDLTYLPNGFGVVKVNIIETNRNFYDPRKDRKFYYCLIKNNQAEFYQHAIYDCAVGDTIEVNTNKRTFLISNNNKRIFEEIMLYDYDRFFDYVRKKHQKF
jgi:hypothetical protein